MKKTVNFLLCSIALFLPLLMISCIWSESSVPHIIKSAEYKDKTHFYLSGEGLNAENISDWLWVCKNVDRKSPERLDSRRDFTIRSITTIVGGSGNFIIEVEPPFTPGDETFLYSRWLEGETYFKVPSEQAVE